VQVITSQHPRSILLGAQAVQAGLPVCDHYCGVMPRMQKSLALQRTLFEAHGACLFDVTLDCEDGAPVGQELAHAHAIADLLNTHQPAKDGLRVGVRFHATQSTGGHFENDARIILSAAASQVAYVMVPKVECIEDVDFACAVIDTAQAAHESGNVFQRRLMPIHVLIESPSAVNQVHAIAAHPRVQSVSFGVMDFISSHGGAIPDSAMTVEGQFSHPLVVRAKLEIASACHAAGKVPSHCVVTEFKDVEALKGAAKKAAELFGYTRMWSIHPDQIRPIIDAFAPDASAVAHAGRVIHAAIAADWAPVAIDNQLHDRASYRYYWHLIERAHATGVVIPTELQQFF
jgi:citrate lyase subunit beta/citryl-CoA lyase